MIKRYLAIDGGTERHGIAISDAHNRIALPRAAVPVQQALHIIKALVTHEEIGEVLVGLPYGLDKQETAMTKIARRLHRALEKILAIPVRLVDERLTTKMTGNIGKLPKGERDSMSAAILLQMELDRMAQSPA